MVTMPKSKTSMAASGCDEDELAALGCDDSTALLRAPSCVRSAPATPVNVTHELRRHCLAVECEEAMEEFLVLGCRQDRLSKRQACASQE